MEHFLVAPGKYVLYNCDELKRRCREQRGAPKRTRTADGERRHRCRGRLIGDATYGPEYATLRGEMDDMRTAARDKNCDFVPGVESPPVHAGGKPIH